MHGFGGENVSGLSGEVLRDVLVRLSLRQAFKAIDRIAALCFYAQHYKFVDPFVVSFVGCLLRGGGVGGGEGGGGAIAVSAYGVSGLIASSE